MKAWKMFSQTIHAGSQHMHFKMQTNLIKIQYLFPYNEEIKSY